MSLIRKFVLLLLFFPAFALHAEETPAPTIFGVTTFTIHPGTAPVFEQIVLRYKEAAMKLGQRPSWFAYSPGIGNDLEYNFATPVTSFASYAEMTDDVMTAFGMEEAQKVAAMATRSIANVESFTVRQRPELSIAGPELTAPPEIVFNYTIVVKRGMNQAWEASMANVIEASQKTAPGTHWSTFQGGIAAPNMYGVRVNLNWKDLDTPPKPLPVRLIEAFGERKGQKMWQDNLNAIESIETNVSRFRADLSHLPAN